MLLEDDVDEGVLGGEASIERADSDAGPGGDFLDAGLDAELGECCAGSLEDALTVCLGIAAERAIASPRVSGGHVPLMLACRG